MLRKLFRSRRSKATLFTYIDCFFPKQKEKVLFVVKDRTYFSGNIRVMLEKYLSEEHKEIFIYKDGVLSPKLVRELKASGVTVLDGFTLYTLWHLLTSSTIILSHNPRDAHISRKCKHRQIINLWHGVAIKQIELLMPNIAEEKSLLLVNNSILYDMVIASSEEDKRTNANAFGVSLDKVHVTGLPRYEILKENHTLGEVLKEEEIRIKQIKGHRKLILFAPTFRENHVSAISQITTHEWKALQTFSENSNILFGIRPHPYDLKYLPQSIKGSTHFHLFENSEYTEANILLKHADILIVDFSSIWIDYLLLHKPIIGFAKDYRYYLKRERGFIYDFNTVFPALFTEDINLLIEELNKQLKCTSPSIYKESLKLFHAHTLEYNYAQNIYDNIQLLTQKVK